jgi:hypothetical protein
MEYQWPQKKRSSSHRRINSSSQDREGERHARNPLWEKHLNTSVSQMGKHRA